MRQHIDSISDWIEDQVRDRHLRWIGTGGTVLTVVLAVLGLSNVLPFGLWPSLLLALVVAVFAVVALGLSRRYMRRELSEAKRVLAGYGKRVKDMQENDRLLFHIVSWHENVMITKHGDTEIQRDLTVRAGSEAVPAIWNLTYRNSDSHLSSSVRGRVRVSAYHLNEDGSEGVRIVTIPEWSGQQLRVFLHFSPDLAPNSQVSLRLSITWPKFSADILDGLPEEMRWTFRRQMEEFSSTILMDHTFLTRDVRVTGFQDSPKPDVTRRGERKKLTKIHLGIKNAEVDKVYGYSVSRDIG